MPNIKDTKRLVKRIILSNLLIDDYAISLTPLLSGKHGIGKSQVAKQIAEELDGVCITIEGGTLKEGEITGIPYQYKKEGDEVAFKFLPYYVVERIQKAEKMMFNKLDNNYDVLLGDENRYSNNDLGFDDKIKLIKSGEIKPVILFFDEINRTDNAVFKELMNIILTRTVNGYKFPWWVFIIAAMNPNTEDGMYAINEIDPAQLDRFIKINVREDYNEWLEYAINNNYDRSIINFISNNSFCLSSNSRELEDDEKPSPSPRGWSMINIILSAKDKINDFFSDSELQDLEDDIKKIISCKVGPTASTLYFTSLTEPYRLIVAEDLFDFNVSSIDKQVVEILENQSTARNSLTSKSIINYLKNNIDIIKLDKNKLKILNERISFYIGITDSSSRVLFVSLLSECKSNMGTEIFNYCLDCIDDDLLELLQANNINELKIVEDF